MSDVEGLLALYGALDRAIAGDEVDVGVVSPLLGAYQRPETVGWYEHQYLPWVAEAAARAERRGERPVVSEERTERRPRIFVRHRDEAPDAPDAPMPVERPVPPVDRPTLSPRIQDIHDALAAFGPTELEGRMAARRLLAVTVVARALPDYFGPNGSHADVANNALTFRVPGEDADDASLAQRAKDLHKTFAVEFTDMRQWRTVVRSAVRQGVLDASVLKQEAAPPCTGRLILRATSTGADPDPCLVMEAEFTTKAVTFEQAKAYLQPENWKYQGSLWCHMDKYEESADSTTAKYHETVSTDCGSASPAWTVSTDLQFWFSHPTPFEARAEYDFAPGLPTVGSDILIDEGSLRVIKLSDDSVNVKTTKRVRFAGNFDGPGLAMFMCASGYSTVLEDVVFTASKSSSPQPFPVPAPQGVTTMSPPKATSSPAGGDTVESLISEATTFVNTYVQDIATTCKSSMAKVQQGTYKVEDAWADGIKIWTSYLSGMGKALDLGSRAAKVVKPEPTDDD